MSSANIREILKSGSYSKFLKFFGLLVLVAAVPFTVFVAQQQQDIRQRASESSNCRDETRKFCRQYTRDNSGIEECLQEEQVQVRICDPAPEQTETALQASRDKSGQAKTSRAFSGLNCTPGESTRAGEGPCPGGTGTCGGHYYCRWGASGNYESEFICETAADTCRIRPQELDRQDVSQRRDSSQLQSAAQIPTPTPAVCDCVGGRWKGSACGNRLNEACSAPPAVSQNTAQVAQNRSCSCVAGRRQGAGCGNTQGEACTTTSYSTAGGCQLPDAPPIVFPKTPEISAGSYNFSWGAVSGATKYAVRIDDKSNAWGACDKPSEGDVCTNNVTGTNYPYTFRAGKQYTLWVHAINSCGTGDLASISVTVPSSTTSSDAAHCAAYDGWRRNASDQKTNIYCTGWDSKNTSCKSDQLNPYYFASCVTK